MYKIIEKENLAPGIKRIRVEAPLIARKTHPGNFIILRIGEFDERIPLTVADYDRDKGTITLIFQEVGYTTERLGSLEAGDYIQDLVGPLGKRLDLEGCKKVICIGGGSGTALLYPIVKAFHEKGAEILTITGARNKELVILEKELRTVSDKLFITTDDGSYGRHGFVTDILADLLITHSDIDLVVAIGPVPMMKAVSRITPANIKTIVSLNALMVDGTGMCGGCRVTVGGETKFTCVDGPAFDGHQVDFDEIMNRQSYYQEEEKHICRLGREVNS
ncbi:MAG: sulfide/dihydroorotate dehydrogenase-like FAD/NAD-binding protein [Halanaerobiaceae bacterium]|jgi:ferredoxin--NADP+ reductase|nr:sulfide/dihydroorotate dehydrogenase-like FAD/NAD-binding protein [Halanaerobiaceae bacterium]